MLIVALMEARRFEYRLPGNAGVAVVVADGEAELVGVAEAIANIAGDCAIQKSVVRSLAVRPHIGSGGGIVELAEQSAKLSAAVARGKTAAVGVDAELGSASGAAMGEKLDHTIHGI